MLHFLYKKLKEVIVFNRILGKFLRTFLNLSNMGHFLVLSLTFASCHDSSSTFLKICHIGHSVKFDERVRRQSGFLNYCQQYFVEVGHHMVCLYASLLTRGSGQGNTIIFSAKV